MQDATAIPVKELKIEEGTIACRETEARREKKKPTSVETKPEAAQKEEVPTEDATIVLVGEPRKRRRDQELAVEHRRKTPKNLTRENCGPQEKLAVDHRWTTRRAKVEQKTPIDMKMSRCATVA